MNLFFFFFCVWLSQWISQTVEVLFRVSIFEVYLHSFVFVCHRLRCP